MHLEREAWRQQLVDAAPDEIDGRAAEQFVGAAVGECDAAIGLEGECGFRELFDDPSGRSLRCIPIGSMIRSRT
ncbi:MAG: hypothetical protein J7513_15355 [Solirubrobacteraceae bacterium]|nr:hypothetical protein [Solirubrobacteraceae bacterium]